MYAANFF